MIPYEQVVKEDLNLGTGTVTLDAPGGGVMPGTQINLTALGLPLVTQVWNPGSVGAGAIVQITVTVLGAVLGDFCMVSFDNLPVGCVALGMVTAANTVTVTIYNLGSLVTVPSGNLRTLVLHTQ